MPDNLRRVNAEVKRRELWRPLAPSVLAERHTELFDMRLSSPFMLLAGHVRPEWQARLQAVVHVDGSARPQAVSADTNPLFHRLIVEFEKRTGLPAVLNTSFNHSDEPLVNAPDHASPRSIELGIQTLIIR